MTTKVKICGITDLRDAVDAIEGGADFLGFNFVEASPRYIAPIAAAEIIDEIKGQILSVGVFANQPIDHVISVSVETSIDIVQFHGDEPAGELQMIRDNLRLDCVKAFRMSSDFDGSRLAGYQFAGILIDAYSPKAIGGTGELADWKRARAIAATNSRVFLAGGLDPDNVADAVRFVRPYAVDVASGVESAPGKKDPRKVEEFIRNAKKA